MVRVVRSTKSISVQAAAAAVGTRTETKKMTSGGARAAIEASNKQATSDSPTPTLASPPTRRGTR